MYYQELYKTVNILLDQYTYRLSNFINEMGHPSIFVPRDEYSSLEALLKTLSPSSATGMRRILQGLEASG